MSIRRSIATTWRRLVLLAVALAVSAPALFVEFGPLGAVVAVVGVGVALVTTGVLGVATLHLGALALVNVSASVSGSVDTPTVVGLVLLETAAAFLFVSDVPHGRRLETGALFVPVAVAVAVGVTMLAEANGFATGALALVGVVAVGTYLLHRYAQVRLGLAAGELTHE